MSKAVGELAKLGTKMSAGRRPEATSPGLCGRRRSVFSFSGFRPATSSHHASRSRIAWCRWVLSPPAKHTLQRGVRSGPWLHRTWGTNHQPPHRQPLDAVPALWWRWLAPFGCARGGLHSRRPWRRARTPTEGWPLWPHSLCSDASARTPGPVLN